MITLNCLRFYKTIFKSSIALLGLSAIFELLIRKKTAKYGGKFLEFPDTKKEDLDKFVNYEEELGWEPLPCSKQMDNHHAIYLFNIEKAKVSYLINEDGSRWQPEPGRKIEGPYVEFFGDSLCFGRKVGSNETFQFYLEDIHGIGPCKNFGVGNYGIDQSYLRARKRMKGGGIAVLILPVVSLYRIGAIYKHYSEIGNTWAIKPRFKYDSNDRKLILVPRPFKEKKELLNIYNYRDYLRNNDNFFEVFKKITPHDKKSQLLHCLSNKIFVSEMINEIISNTNNKIERKTFLYVRAVLKKIFKNSSYNMIRRDLLSMANGEEGMIFALLAKHFTELALERGSKALIVLSSQGWIIENPRLYREVAALLTGKAKMLNIEVLDFGIELIALDEATKKKYNAIGHPSPEDSKFFAEWLAERIRAAQ